MWTPAHGRAANRSGLRYPTDLTEDEWAIVAAMIPPARHDGRRRSVNVGAERDFLYPVDWLPMESIAQGPATEEYDT